MLIEAVKRGPCVTLSAVGGDPVFGVILSIAAVDGMDALYCTVFFFFFQAEDGIRDYKVTGVQTCALPICARIMGLDDPSAKMSKSLGETRKGHAIGLVDPPDVIRHAITHAVTDSGREVRREQASPGVTNLLTIYELLSGRSREAVQAAFVGKGYTVLKRAVADLVVTTLEPIRQRYLDLSAH